MKEIIETEVNEKAVYTELLVIPVGGKYIPPIEEKVIVIKTLSFIDKDNELQTIALCRSEKGQMFNTHISNLTFESEVK